MGVCNCSMFCCMLLSSIAIILMGKRELIVLLNLSSWYLVMVERLLLAVPRGCLQFVIVVFPDHTHLLFLTANKKSYRPLKILSKLKVVKRESKGHPISPMKRSYVSIVSLENTIFYIFTLEIELFKIYIISNQCFHFISLYIINIYALKTLYTFIVLLIVKTKHFQLCKCRVDLKNV